VSTGAIRREARLAKRRADADRECGATSALDPPERSNEFGGTQECDEGGVVSVPRRDNRSTDV
jgi:hypothetical protein